jgi:TetR/AcrR family transcriptional repressor of nem operon
MTKGGVRVEGQLTWRGRFELDNQYGRTYWLSMARPSHREKIIESGVDTAYRRGFATTGLREFAAAAGVPAGSFTNHFRSKEAFGIVVLDRYFEQLQDIVERTLRDETCAPLDRLRAYFDTIIGRLQSVGWRHGCLIGNMSLEAAEHSEVFAAWVEPFREAVKAGQARGEVRADLEANEIAEFLLAGWHGAMMRMKVERSPEPLERFKRIAFATVLAPPDKGGSLV